jgi:exosortase E/protease (VPEID-CTERM system)
MSLLGSDGACAGRGDRRTEAAFWGVLAALAAVFLAELLTLTLLFDSANAAGLRRGLLGGLVYNSGAIANLVVTTAAGVLVFGGRRLAREVLDSRAGRSGISAPALLIHFAVFAAFAMLCRTIFGAGEGPQQPDTFWILTWAGLGLSSALLLVAVAVPVRCWVAIARRVPDALAFGLAIGVGSTVIGWQAARLWKGLGAATLSASAWVLSFLHADFVCRPEEYVIGTPSFQVTVAAGCSGYEGMGLILIFLGVYLWARRSVLQFPQVLVLLPLGVALAWILNVLRIVALVEIGTRVSDRIAMGGFHSQAGWLAFIATALGLVAISRRSFSRVEGKAVRVAEERAVVPYLAPLAALVGGTMLSAAFTVGFDALYPLRVAAVLAVLWLCRRGYAERLWAWSWWAFGAGVAVFLLWMALEPRPSGGEGGRALADGLSRLPAAAAGLWLAARVMGSVVLVPVAEELAFRGYLLRRLVAADFLAVDPRRVTWVAVLVSSCLFGVLHSRWLAGAFAGLVYAMVYLRRGRLGDAVLAHAVTNAMIAAAVLATGSWSLWD